MNVASMDLGYEGDVTALALDESALIVRVQARETPCNGAQLPDVPADLFRRSLRHQPVDAPRPADGRASRDARMGAAAPGLLGVGPYGADASIQCRACRTWYSRRTVRL